MNIHNYCFPPEEYRKLLSSTNGIKLDIGEELEMELRFKKMTKFQFERIYDWLGTLAYPSTTTEDICTSYSNPQDSSGEALYRCIESPSYQYGHLCQKKRRVKWVDLEYFHIKQRLSISIEQVVPKIPPMHLHTVSVVRRRTRTTFDIGSEKIMLSRVVVESKDTTQKYEMEIELSRPYFSEKIQGIIPTLLYHLFPHQLLKIPHRTIRPKNLLREEVPKLMGESFTVTNKMDGVRFLIYFLPNTQTNPPSLSIVAQSPYGHEQEFMFIKSIQLERRSSSVVKSLLTIDAEYFKNSFHIFDCSHHNPNHHTRLEYLRDLLSSLHLIPSDKLISTNNPLDIPFCGPSFQIKSFTRNIRMGTHVLLQQQEADNDGLIFTSKDGKTIKKWKYPHKHSIDFRIKKSVGGFGLYVFDGTKYEEVLFHGAYLQPMDSEEIVIIDGAIYECGWKQDSFYIMRHRPDRRYPNKLDVAEKNWTDMIHPFTSDELCSLLDGTSEERISGQRSCKRTSGEHKHTTLTGTSKAYRSFHNAVKRDLINRFCREKQVVDIGSGKGGDLHKYMHTKPKMVYFIEPNRGYCNEFNQRAVESGFDRTKFLLVPGSFECLEIAVEFRADVVSSFFSFTFFCYTPELMENVIQKISTMLNSGGYFIGTVMDGHRTVEFLKDQPEQTFHIPGTSGYIKRTEQQMTVSESLICEEESTINNVSVVDCIEISLPDSKTVPIQVESIVYMDQLESCCNKYGLVLRECTNFSDSTCKIERPKDYRSTTLVATPTGGALIPEGGTQEELDLLEIMNRLYTTFVFQKN